MDRNPEISAEHVTASISFTKTAGKPWEQLIWHKGRRAGRLDFLDDARKIPVYLEAEHTHYVEDGKVHGIKAPRQTRAAQRFAAHILTGVHTDTMFWREELARLYKLQLSNPRDYKTQVSYRRVDKTELSEGCGGDYLTHHYPKAYYLEDFSNWGAFEKGRSIRRAEIRNGDLVDVLNSITDLRSMFSNHQISTPGASSPVEKALTVYENRKLIESLAGKSKRKN